MPTLALCLDVGTVVMEGALLNLSCCISFNLTWASFLISIVHIPVSKSRGPFILGSFVCCI